MSFRGQMLQQNCILMSKKAPLPFFDLNAPFQQLSLGAADPWGTRFCRTWSLHAFLGSLQLSLGYLLHRTRLAWCKIP